MSDYVGCIAASSPDVLRGELADLLQVSSPQIVHLEVKGMVPGGIALRVTIGTESRPGPLRRSASIPIRGVDSAPSHRHGKQIEQSGDAL